MTEPKTLTAWAEENKVKDKMLWKGAAEAQFKAFRRLEALFEVRVLGTHCSKSIDLPVVEAKRPGLRIVMRDNFYNLAVTVESERALRFGLTHPSWSITDKDNRDCYFEGFDRAGVPVYEPIPGDPYKRFSFHANGDVTPMELAVYISEPEHAERSIESEVEIALAGVKR